MTGALLTLLNAQSLAAYTAAGFWGDETLYAIAARHARSTPNRFAVRDRHRRLTYAALIEAANRLAGSLAGRGIRSGQRVAVWLPSRIETAIVLLACSRNGYVCCPSLHRNHTTAEIIALVDRMRAAAIIADPGFGAASAGPIRCVQRRKSRSASSPKRSCRSESAPKPGSAMIAAARIRSTRAMISAVVWFRCSDGQHT